MGLLKASKSDPDLSGSDPIHATRSEADWRLIGSYHESLAVFYIPRNHSKPMELRQRIQVLILYTVSLPIKNGDFP